MATEIRLSVNELRERAIAIAKKTFTTDDRPIGSLGVISDASEIMRRHDSHALVEAILRELVLVRDRQQQATLEACAEECRYEVGQSSGFTIGINAAVGKLAEHAKFFLNSTQYHRADKAIRELNVTSGEFND